MVVAIEERKRLFIVAQPEMKSSSRLWEKVAPKYTIRLRLMEIHFESRRWEKAFERLMRTFPSISLAFRRELDGRRSIHIILKSKLVACSTQSGAYCREQYLLVEVVICHVDE